MLNEKTIKALEEKGFKRWTKGSMDRLYINAETALDFEYDTNKSGHVSGAYLNGERISNSRGAELVNSKTYIDVATGELVSNHDMMREAAQAIMDAVAGEIEAAEAAENDDTPEIVEGVALTEDQIRSLEFVGFYFENDGDTQMIMDTRAVLNPVFEVTEFKGEKYTYKQAQALLETVTTLDINTLEIHSECPEMKAAAEDLIEAANEQIRKFNAERAAARA